MTFLKIISWLLVLTAGLGVDRFLDSQYHFSVVGEIGKGLQIIKNDLLKPVDLLSPKGRPGSLETAKEIGPPCNADGKCDNVSQICEPVKTGDRTELRCVSTPTSVPLDSADETPVASSPKSGTKVTTPSSGSSVLPTSITSGYGKGKMRISSASPSSSKDFPSTISLYPNLSSGETLDLSGWRLVTKGDNVEIPKAVEIYDPYGFINTSSVKVKSGDSIYIYSSQSKLGASFRLNKCLGYFETAYHFKPSLSLNCPALYSSRSEIINYSSACQDYITSLSSCTIPDLNRQGLVNDSMCREFLSQVNYGGCFSKHKSDSDFLAREWRLFLGDQFQERNILDAKHDRVQLLNKAGTLIDEYIY